MKYIREIIVLLILIIGSAAVVQNCKKNHNHKPEQVVIQHAAGASEGPGPFGWSKILSKKAETFVKRSGFLFISTKLFFYWFFNIFKQFFHRC